MCKVIYFSSKCKLDNGYVVDKDTIKQCDDKVRKHLLEVKNITIRGVHNFENICAAIAATSTLVDKDVAIEVSRTISGLKSFDEEIVLIAGGADKNLDYNAIAEPILEKVKVLILMGETSVKIFNAVKNEEEKQKKEIKIITVENLNQAVIMAKRNAAEGQIVLFSPASTSFDMFKNMYDRGNKFKDIVNKMTI